MRNTIDCRLWHTSRKWERIDIVLENQLKNTTGNFIYVGDYKRGSELRMYEFDCPDALKNHLLGFTYSKEAMIADINDFTCVAVMNKEYECEMVRLSIFKDADKLSYVVDLTSEEKEALTHSFRMENKSLFNKRRPVTIER